MNKTCETDYGSATVHNHWFYINSSTQSSHITSTMLALVPESGETAKYIKSPALAILHFPSLDSTEAAPKIIYCIDLCGINPTLSSWSGNRLLPRRPVGVWRCCLGFGEEREGVEYLGSWAAAVKQGHFHMRARRYSVCVSPGGGKGPRDGDKATATWVRAARGQQSATFKEREASGRHPEHQSGLTASVSEK